MNALALAAPYLQVAAAGTYLAAAIAILARRWAVPSLGHPWFVLLLFIAFGWERAVPELASVAEPATFLCALAVGLQIALARGGRRRGLWRALALVPVLVLLLVAASDRFAESEAAVMRAAESVLLALPPLLAFAAAVPALLHRLGEDDRPLRGLVRPERIA